MAAIVRGRGAVSEHAERQVIISGLGRSAVGRRLGRSAARLTMDAVRAALDDAGLVVSDVDGVASFPGARPDDYGVSPVGIFDFLELSRIRPRWFSGGGEGPSQLGAVFNAIAAIASGYCRHVLVYRTTLESSHPVAHRRAAEPAQPAAARRITGFQQWSVPFGAPSPANWLGLYARRYMFEYGLTSEELGALAINSRRNAALNEAAVYREPICMDDYLSARMISSPFRLYDCDVPVDGSVAVVLSHAETATDIRSRPIRIAAVGMQLDKRFSWGQWSSTSDWPAFGAAAHLWSRTELTPADVDTAHLYDGISFASIIWLEALGLCPVGGSGAFLGGGANISLTGRLPLNTDGGQLSAGRLHGYGHLYESCLQLRGEASDRQVPNTPEIAALGVGSGPLVGCMLLTR
jgi:acetyl-CoA acetyltransferase